MDQLYNLQCNFSEKPSPVTDKSTQRTQTSTDVKISTESESN